MSSQSDDERPAKYPRKTRPKISGNFSEEDTIKIINYVKKMPVIWNMHHKDYSDKTKRNTAWAQIYKQFGGRHHETDLRTKWSNLRIQYRITVGKLKGKREENASVWRHFAALKFLESESMSQIPVTQSQSESQEEPEVLEDLSPVKKVSKKQSKPKFVEGSPSKRFRDSKDDPNLQLCNYMYSELTELDKDNAAILRRKLLKLFISFDPSGEFADV